MSNREQRWSARRLGTLAMKIQSLGITVPDQVRAARQKEAMRLGLDPGVSEQRLRRAWWRRMTRQQYEVFSYAKFAEGEIAENYGGLPDPVRAIAEEIKKAYPEISLQVHATHDDPWLIARSGTEDVIVCGWYRTWIKKGWAKQRVTEYLS